MQKVAEIKNIPYFLPVVYVQMAVSVGTMHGEYNVPM